MKKFKLRKFYAGFVIFGILGYFELIFRIFTKINVFNASLIFVSLFNIFLSIIFNILFRLFDGKINKIIFEIIVFLLGFIYSVQLCMFKMFGFYFDWSLIGASGQVASFAGDGIRLVLENIIGIMMFMLPFLLLNIFRHYVVLEKRKFKLVVRDIGIAGCVIGAFFLCLLVNKNDNNSAYKLFYNINNIDLNIKKFGVLNSFFIDTKRNLFGFQEKINIIKIDEEEKVPEEKVYKYNNVDIDFDKLISNENNATVKMMHEYFKNETGTKQNEYTNYFKGKNLILFMAESFNEIAVREDLTPTLYRLVNSGFSFPNFYTPTISSTIGGEFQELTGLVAASGFLAPWKSGENYFPYGIGTSFKNLGYNTFAYHNHNYTFQSRNNYLAALGFDNFKGCRNGLESLINCKQWPESDVEMIDATFDDYINSNEPFFTYYVTVSGHGDYSFSQSAMARKHKDDVAHLNYSEKPLSYLAAQMELDQALELLINKLSAAGRLDDTVIALVGDHYPYYLSVDEVNEISNYEKDGVVEINHSNFILWNNKMEKVIIDKVGSQIDVLPTLYNLFGVSYDSRLIIGKDILSTEPGLAIFGNSSWVSDKGTYFAGKNKFVAKDGVNVDDNYVKYMNSIVSNKIVMSKNILANDYYRKVFGDK